MLPIIIDAVDAFPELSGWQVRETRKTSAQRFLNKQATESSRSVETLAWEVEVLVNQYPKRRSQEGATTGNARFTLDAASLPRLGKELSQAAAAAALVRNQPYTMTNPGPSFSNLALADPAINAQAPEALAQLEQRLRAAAAAQGAGIRLAAAEFFAERSNLRLVNSQGLQAAQESTLFSGEFVLLATDGRGGESEVFRLFKRRRLQDWDLEAEVAHAAEAGRQRARASLPPSGRFDVALSGDALDHLFDWLVAQASAAAKYNHIIEREPGDILVLAEPGASTLTLWHNSQIPWAVGSYRFDPSGSPSCRRLLVEHGQLHGFWANARYAQYLQMAQPTGELGNLEVEPGRRSCAELLVPSEGRPLLHLTEFSYFEPNPVTGEFSAEIRLGELIGTDGSRQSVRGGSVSGSSREAFSRIQLSRETVRRERYHGPQVVLLPGLTLAGA
jgi:predicted Zn-dependent protease